MLSKLADKSWSLAQKIGTYIPSTGLNTICQALDKQAKSILDIGCGDGSLMKLINKSGRFYAVGIDIFEPYLMNCKRIGSHADLIKGDIRKLPFKSKSFDVVLSVEVLEHLEKAEGRAFLEAIERIAREKVVIATPFGEYEQSEFHENPYQAHKAIWRPSELKELGYKIRGVGLNLPRKSSEEGQVVFLLPKILKPVAKLMWSLATPFTYFSPQLAGRGICVKVVGAGQ